MMLTGVGPPPVAAGGGSPSYAFVGTFTDQGAVSGDTISTTMNIGTAAASRTIVIVGTSQNTPTLASATINGVSCTKDVSIVQTGIFSCPGVSYGSGTQTITVTWTGSGFLFRSIGVYELSNLASTTVVHTASGTTSAATISVANHDLMFSVNSATNPTAATYSTSSVAPSNSGLLWANVGGYADWLIASTNASFSVNPFVTGQNNFAVATYH